MKVLVILLPFLCSVYGHGYMVTPPCREGGDEIETSPTAMFWFSQGCTIGCKCNEDNAMEDFFSHGCDSPQEPTLNDPKDLTFNIYRNYSNSSMPIPVPKDWTRYHPWRAPGTAQPLDPCGLSGGSTKNNDIAGGYGNYTIVHKQGYPGSKLPHLKQGTTWTAGSVVEVSWLIAANHGGGYQYRLCPKSSPLTEECFMKTPLDFHSDLQILRFQDGRTLEIKATRVSKGVLPKGSTWTKNPIPPCDDISGGFQGVGCEKPSFLPPKGCDDTCWGYQPCFEGEFPDGCPGPIKTKEIPSIVDQVIVPSDLTPGEYVIGFRWDCEHTPQIWESCGDVTIVVK